MNWFKRFAGDHPLGFTFVTLALLIVLMGGSAAIAIGLLDYEMTDVEPQLIGQIVATVGFLLLLWRFEWLGLTGITHLGNRRLWLITLLILIYTAVSALVAFFGTLSVDLSLSPEMAPVLVHTTMAGVMEEILFRGLILYVLVSQWGSTRRGVVSAVMVSAFLFGALHFVNLARGSADITTLQVLEAFVSGILYGALVLIGGSVWPAVILHSLINLLVNIGALNVAGFTVTAGNYLTLILLEIPLIIYGFYLLTKITLRKPTIIDLKDVQTVPAKP